MLPVASANSDCATWNPRPVRTPLGRVNSRRTRGQGVQPDLHPVLYVVEERPSDEGTQGEQQQAQDEVGGPPRGEPQHHHDDPEEEERGAQVLLHEQHHQR